MYPACRRGVRTGRISWKGVAAELDSGRSGEQCKGKWRGPRLAADAPEDESGQESEDESEEEDGAQRQQPLRGYTFWSEAEADTAAQLLGAVGARLERDRGFARTARSLPEKLRAAVSLVGGSIPNSATPWCNGLHACDLHRQVPVLH